MSDDSARDDYDSPWKDALTRFFPEFMAFYFAAAAARISATQAFQHCAKQNIQVHGGMGFTWDLDCHLFYRRAKLLSLSLGSPRHWKNRLVDRWSAASAPACAPKT